MGRILKKLEAVNPWHFLWVAVILAELFTAALNAVQSHLLWGFISYELLTTGAIAALFVPALVAPIVIIFVMRTSKLQEEFGKSPGESEEKFRTIFEASNDGILIVDPITRKYIDVNAAMCRMTGYSREEFLKLGLNDLHRSEDLPFIHSEFERAVTTNAKLFANIPVMRKDGTVFYADIGHTTVTLNGSICAVGIFRDITERKRKDKEVETQKEQLALIIFYKDRDSKFVRVNSIFARALERLKEDFVGKTVFDFYSPRIAQGMTDDDQEVMQSGRPKLNIIEQYESAHGLRWVQTDKIPLYEENGMPSGLIGFAQDITERKQAEEALRENEQRLTSIYNTVGDVIFQLAVESEEEYRFTSINSAFSRVTGLPAEAVVGKRVNDVIPEPSLSMVLGKYRQAIEEKAIVRWEETSDYPTGRLIGDVSVSPVFDAEGRCIFMVGSVHDITERKRAEERILLAHDMQKRLSSGIAHEINTPNTFIMSNAQMLQDIWRDADRILSEHWRQKGDFSLGGLPFSDMRGQVNKVMGYVIEGSERISRIVNKLKEYTSPLGDFENEIIDVNELVRSAILVLDTQIKSATDNFSWIPYETVQQARGNRQALEQVVINLISNAVQALRDRTQGISVSTGYDREENLVIIEVKDEGIGMNQDVLSKAMEPFYTTKRDRGGIGMGLGISLSIVNNHKGSLELQSESKKGTIATVRLPGCNDSGAGPHA